MALGLAAVAGCGDTTGGVPSAGAGSVGGSPSSVPLSSSPYDGLDFSSNEDLCELLTEEEATSLGGSETGEPHTSFKDGSPLCTWSEQTGIDVVFLEGGQTDNLRPEPGVTLHPATIAGQPAVYARTDAEIVMCEYVVEISDQDALSFRAIVHDAGKGKYKHCPVARKLASTVIPKVT